jgi:pyrophosphatase PpaX
MKKYQYILLDWDGNLAKTLDIWLEACRITLKKRGLELSDTDIAASFGAFTKYMKDWGIEDVDGAIEEADDLAKQKLPNVELYPDALEVLEALHAAGKQLALITTSPRENLQHLLEKYNIARFFHAIIAAEDVEHHKPHPEPLEKALRLLGGITSEAIMIGDSDKDLGAANNAGIDSILFYPSEHQKFYSLDTLTRLKPTYTVDDFRQILRIV